MTHRYSETVNNARLNAIETAIGTSAVMKFFTGAEPANCAAADPTGTVCTFQLPSDWLGNAAAGVKSKSGTWSGTASAAGTVASYRIYDSGTVTCHIQGSVGMAGTNITLDNNVIAVSQVITFSTYAITAANT